jgi:hypothetical protein
VAVTTTDSSEGRGGASLCASAAPDAMAATAVAA